MMMDNYMLGDFMPIFGMPFSCRETLHFLFRAAVIFSSLFLKFAGSLYDRGAIDQVYQINR